MNCPTPTPTPKPLWRVMHDAFLASDLSGPDGCSGFAAELRAIAEEVRRLAKLWSSEEVADWLDMEADLAEKAETQEAPLRDGQR